MNPTVRAILQGGFGVTGVDTFRGLYALADHARAAEAIWPQVDVLLLPTPVPEEQDVSLLLARINRLLDQLDEKKTILHLPLQTQGAPGKSAERARA